MADQSQDKQTSQDKNANNLGDTLHTLFLAGVGAIAATGEKGSELFEQLVKKGESTVNQSKDKNQELLQKAKGKVSNTAEDALKTYLKGLSPEDREHFVQSVQKAAEDAKANAQEVADNAQEVADKVAEGANDATKELEAADAAADKSDGAKSDDVKDDAAKDDDVTSTTNDATITEDPKDPKDAPASPKE